MTSPRFPANRRRAVAAIGAVSAGLLALSACDKPTPLATVTIGTTSVNSEATCYDDGHALDTAALQKCLKETSDAKTVKVDPDATVRFGVDPAIADKGWTFLLNGQQITGTSKKTYTTIPGNVFFNEQYGGQSSTGTVTIVEGDGKKAYGLWTFKVKKKDD
ncbi:DUF2771 domain-containing protein [Streptomyces sp. P6-2-1]|uniref:DUF2771 domain-containing protein n=1 Tax=unclassified Streptomyces TaxID=2593676 RepID=UPI003D35C370